MNLDVRPSAYASPKATSGSTIMRARVGRSRMTTVSVGETSGGLISLAVLEHEAKGGGADRFKYLTQQPSFDTRKPTAGSDVVSQSDV